MLRSPTPDGYLLITHPDHARLAGQFAEAWGNALFPAPEPRSHVLEGISRHDDGWLQRDASPLVTRAGKPSAFSSELVGKYSAFEEIDLLDYLAVRRRAVNGLASENPYAGLLTLLHTRDLLANRADRSTIRPDQLPLLDAFLSELDTTRLALLATLRADPALTPSDTSDATLHAHFQLLQACDNLSLIACVDHPGPSDLLHPLPTLHGPAPVTVRRTGPRRYQLDPYPLREPEHHFTLAARSVPGHTFPDSATLAALFHQAPPLVLTVTIHQ